MARGNWANPLERIERAKGEVEQAKARYQALLNRQRTEERKLDTRRKIILGGLLLDAASRDERFARDVTELLARISRDHDRQAFLGWSPPWPAALSFPPGETGEADRTPKNEATP